jgi:transcription elongation factor GreA
MTEPENPVIVQSTRLKKLAKKKRYEDLENEWMEFVENESTDLNVFVPTLQVLVRQEEASRAESLFWFLLSARTESGGDKAGIAAARKGAIALCESPLLREEVVSLYQKAYEDRPEIETLVRMTILRKEFPLDEAMRLMDKLLDLREGTFVMDTALMVPGVVARIDEDERAVVVSFEDGERYFASSNIKKIEILDRSDLRAAAVFDPDSLKELAKEQPVELVRRALEAFGPKLTYREMKTDLEGVIPSSSWAKWWKKAKPLIAHCGEIDMSLSSQPTFVLRIIATTFEDRLRAQFNLEGSLEARLGIVLESLDSISERTPEEQEVLTYIAAELAKQTTDGSEGPALGLGVAAVITAINGKLTEPVDVPEVSLESALSAEGGLSEPFFPIENETVAKVALGHIKGIAPDNWHEAWTSAMPGCTKSVCEWIAKGLLKAGQGESLKKAAADILRECEKHVNALVWLWRTVCSGRCPDELKGIDRMELVTSLLSTAERIPRAGYDDKTSRQLLSEIRGAVGLKDYSALREVLKEAKPEQVKHFNDIAERHVSLSEQGRFKVLESIRRLHSSLFVENIELWKEDVIYTTEDGLLRAQEDIVQIINVKLVEVGQEIGRAASYGDLSENAEYTAALEERDRLNKRVNMMKEEMAKAKPIPKNADRTERVTIGSSAKVKDPSGTEETFLFLGPWDADPDNNVFSYRAPFAQGFMGKKVGETVESIADDDTRTWEIISISDGLP